MTDKSKKMPICCEHPVIIPNPLLVSYVIKGFNVIVTPNFVKRISVRNIDYSQTDGRPYLNLSCLRILAGYCLNPDYKHLGLQSYLSYSNYEDRLYYKEFSRYYYNDYLINVHDVHKYFITNDAGEVLPLFIVVPCGKCVLCKSRSVSIISSRNLLQSGCSRYAYFVTLTFRPADYPADCSGSSQTKIIQKFHKRLRAALFKDGYSTSFKYFGVSEFGKKTGRLHFHFLYYDDNPGLRYVVENDDKSNEKLLYVYRFHNYIWNAWNFGFIYVKKVDNSSGASRYCSKYAMKDLGDKESKRWKSIRLGCSYLDVHKDDIVARRSFKDFEVTVDGSVYSVCNYSYIKRYLYPSLTRSICKDVRDKLKYCCLLYCHWLDNPKLFRDLLKKYSKFHDKYLLLYRYLNFIPGDYSKAFSVLPDFVKDYTVVDIVKMFTDVDNANLDVNYLVKCHEYYQESIVVTNTNLFDVDFKKSLVVSEFDKMIENGSDGM